MTEENDFIAFMVSPHDHVVDNHLNMAWFLDSGASDHLVNDESYFSVSSELNSPITISVAKSGESLQAFKVGEINVSQTLNGKIVRCVIKNVLYVPHLRKNLLSAGKIEQNGLSIVLNNGKAEIHNKNDQVAEK